MAKKALTEAQLARRKGMRLKARKTAKAAGKDWQGLSQEERKSIRLQVRKESTRKEAVIMAREAAKAAGKDWKQLSLEERKSFRVRARKELK